MSIINKKIKVYEMTCSSCEGHVERAVKKLDGVLAIKASFKDESADVEYDDELCSLDEIKESIKKSGYSIKSSGDYKFMGILIIAAAIFLLGQKTGGFDMQAKLTNASYAVLFIVGVLTSIHCVGMCGGIMLSQTVSKENVGLLPEDGAKKSVNKYDAVKPSLLYNAGRVLSYTVLGGIIGAFGSVFSLSVMTKAALQIFAAAFMIIMGLNMAGFKAFKSFQIKLPAGACKAKNKSNSPFIVGVLNGFMPCGPLQTMQLFALGTASASKGALSMFMFSIGTVPLMMTFGALAGILTKGYTKKMLKFSGVLIVILGLIMADRGFALAGMNINPFTSFANSSGILRSNSGGSSNVAIAEIKDGVQTITMTATNRGYSPNAFYVQKGIPVKWIIIGEELNSCNNEIAFQNKQYPLKSGENIIEFTPGDKDINFSCWMGMIPGVIKVTDDLNSVDLAKNDPSIPAETTGPSCCAAPIGEEGALPEGPAEEGVYGDDITTVPTDLLVGKASSDGGSLSAVFTGKGYDLQPLIIITENGLSTKLTFDLTEFDDAEGDYVIIDQTTGEEVISFTAEKGVNSVEFSPSKAGGYIVLKNNEIMGMIEVVDDLQASDPEPIRTKYLGEQSSN